MNKKREERTCEGCGLVLARATWNGAALESVSTYQADAPMHLTGNADMSVLFMVCETCTHATRTDGDRWMQHNLQTLFRPSV